MAGKEKKAIRRVVSVEFWSDDKVLDSFTPEDKLFMLYLLTNPHSTQIGIYNLNKKTMAYELGYSVETITVLLDRFENVYGMIRYSVESHEIAIKNYLRHSILSGGLPVEDLLRKELHAVKDSSLIDYAFKNVMNADDLNASVRKVIDEYYASQNLNDDSYHDSYHDSYNDSYHDSYNDSYNDSYPINNHISYIKDSTNSNLSTSNIGVYNSFSAEQSENCSRSEEKNDPKPTDEPKFKIPLNDGTDYAVTQSEIDKYIALYPNVDIEGEYRAMIGWADSNPAKRKTRKGVRRFINGWLAREQDKARVSATNGYNFDRRSNAGFRKLSASDELI